jgi:hypothetical protein
MGIQYIWIVLYGMSRCYIFTGPWLSYIGSNIEIISICDKCLIALAKVISIENNFNETTSYAQFDRVSRRIYKFSLISCNELDKQ